MKNYLKILEWLYLHHQQFDSGEEWREAFLEFLKELLIKDERQTR